MNNATTHRLEELNRKLKIQLARSIEMHGKVCAGCGYSLHVDEIRELPIPTPSCCPRREIVDAYEYVKRARNAEADIVQLKAQIAQLRDR